MGKIKISVCDCEEARTIRPEARFSIISVYTPGDEPSRFVSKPHGVLYLGFDDSMDPKAKVLRIEDWDIEGRKPKIFSKQDARKILTFVNKEMRANINTFIIHCDAGISRSPAIAVALNEIFNGVKKIPRGWGRYNKFVYRSIVAAFKE